MGDYTKLNIDQINEVLDLYIDEKSSEFRPLSLGISNSNYKIVTPSAEYLLKVSNDKNATQVQQEIDILRCLQKNNYEYSLVPLQTKKGKDVYEYGALYGVLYPFIEGIPPGPNDFTCYEIGASLAKIHLIKDDFSGLRPSEELSFPARVIHDYIETDECPEDFKAVYESCLGERAELYLQEKFERGIIHGDLYYDNTLFDNNHISVVLDFEQSGIGNYILDLGISISGTCIEKSRISLPLIDSYLEGYESVRPLPANEKEFLNEAIIFGLMSIALWRIKRFKVGNLNPLMADSYRELLIRAQLFKHMAN